MKLPLALALVIGLIGAVLTWLYVGPLSGLGLFIPATFLGAATYFAAGGDMAALKKTTPAILWGVVWGTVMLVVLTKAGNPALVGIVVGAFTAVTILGALIPIFGFVPGSVVGFATTAAFGLLTKASGTDFSLPSGPFTVMLLSFVIGGLFGYVASLLVGKLVSARTPASA
jgi:hypothetical protein